MFQGDYPDLYCQCGRERCSKYNHIFFRIGPVFQGNEVSGEALWVDIFDYFPEEERSENSELMLNADQAKELMWYLAWEYMPGLRHLELVSRRIHRKVRLVQCWWWQKRRGK